MPATIIALDAKPYFLVSERCQAKISCFFVIFHGFNLKFEIYQLCWQIRWWARLFRFHSRHGWQHQSCDLDWEMEQGCQFFRIQNRHFFGSFRKQRSEPQNIVAEHPAGANERNALSKHKLGFGPGFFTEDKTI